MSEKLTDAAGGNSSNQASASSPSDPERRQFVTHAAATAAGAATLGFPMVARAAEPITLKFQSTWGEKDMLHEFAQDYGGIVDKMSGGRLKLNVLPNTFSTNQLFEGHMLDLVSSGVIDGSHATATFGYGKHKAYPLFGIEPAFGWDANTFLGWVKYGGGQGLYDELVQKILKLNLVGFLAGPMPCQPMGWFNKEVKSLADLKNLKFRIYGLPAEVMAELGVKVVHISADEIPEGANRGLMDGGEFNSPSSDLALGFANVFKTYMLRSYHEAAECFEIVFNKTKYESLPKELQGILRYAAEVHSSDMPWKAMDRFSTDLQVLETQHGVKVYETPEPILMAQLEAWDRIIARHSKDPFFAKVIESQKAWAKRVVGFQLRNEPSRELAFRHFFPA